MKKISLKSVKEFLSRDEMRKISGGSDGGTGGGCGGPCQGNFDCPHWCGCQVSAPPAWGLCVIGY